MKQIQHKDFGITMDYVNCNICNEDNSRLIFIKNNCNIVQCNKCGLVYINPQPTREECNNLYSRETKYFPESVYNGGSKDKEHNRLKDVRKFKERGRILDVGCGDGRFLVSVKNSGFDAYGIEISQEIVELLKAEYGLNIIANSLEQTYMPDRYFDIICMWDVLEHLKNPSLNLNKVNNLLKNDGLLFISTPNISGLEPKLTYYLMGKVFKFWRHPEPPWHLYQFSPDTIRKLLDKSNFEIVYARLEEIPINYTAPLKSENVNIIALVLFRMMYVLIYLLTRLTTREYNSMLVVARKK